MTADEVRAIVREELATFGKSGGDLIKVDHDNDPTSAKWSLERELRAMDARVDALALGIGAQVEQAVEAGIANSVVKVNVVIGKQEV